MCNGEHLEHGKLKYTNVVLKPSKTMKYIIIILLTICSTAFGQTDQTKEIIKTTTTLTYYTFGMSPGQYVDAESLYGFKMKWKKCIIKNRHIRHNNNVEKKINDRLGKNWFVQNIHKLEIRYEGAN